MNRLVITGGKGGLATAIAKRFLDAGWEVDAPGKVEMDVTDPAAVAGFFATRVVDLLVCCAGVISDGPLAKMPERDWDRVFAVNYRGASACARAALPAMASRKAGHILFISSESAIHPPAGQAAYATAKASLLGLGASLAVEYGKSNVRVNTILPGFLETKMTRNVRQSRRDRILADHHLGRFNTPEVVADFIHFLHHGMPHTSGQVFRLDNRT